MASRLATPAIGIGSIAQRHPSRAVGDVRTALPSGCRLGYVSVPQSLSERGDPGESNYSLTIASSSTSKISVELAGMFGCEFGP